MEVQHFLRTRRSSCLPVFPLQPIARSIGIRIRAVLRDWVKVFGKPTGKGSGMVIILLRPIKPGGQQIETGLGTAQLGFGIQTLGKRIRQTSSAKTLN